MCLIVFLCAPLALFSRACIDVRLAVVCQVIFGDVCLFASFPSYHVFVPLSEIFGVLTLGPILDPSLESGPGLRLIAILDTHGNFELRSAIPFVKRCIGWRTIFLVLGGCAEFQEL